MYDASKKVNSYKSAKGNVSSSPMMKLEAPGTQ